MATTFGDVAAESAGWTAEYLRGWRDASAAASRLVQVAIDRSVDRGDGSIHVTALSRLRSEIDRQQPS